MLWLKIYEIKFKLDIYMYLLLFSPAEDIFVVCLLISEY